MSRGRMLKRVKKEDARTAAWLSGYRLVPPSPQTQTLHHLIHTHTYPLDHVLASRTYIHIALCPFVRLSSLPVVFFALSYTMYSSVRSFIKSKFIHSLTHLDWLYESYTPSPTPSPSHPFSSPNILHWSPLAYACYFLPPSLHLFLFFILAFINFLSPISILSIHHAHPCLPYLPIHKLGWLVGWLVC